MAHVFDVTAASDNVRLDGKGQAGVAFTVTNVSGRPLKGHANPVPSDPSAKQWITITGDTDRDFAAGASQQFKVQVAVPTAAKPGKYNFRLDVVSTENPDEDYTQGPTVAFELKAQAPKEHKPFPWWILIVGFVVLIALGVGLFLLLHKSSSATQTTAGAAQISVPTITGMNISDANTALTKAQLKLGNSTEVVVTDTSQIDQVLKQDPAAQDSVDADTAVNVEVGVALVQVPPIIGKLYKDAVDQLSANHLDVGTTTNTNQAGSAPGVVLKASPEPGNSVKSHQTIDLVVQEAQVQVPRLGGQTFAQAAAILANANLRVGSVSGSFIKVEGLRITQQGVTAESPAEGTSVPLGSAVNLSFSGPSVRVNRTLQYAITERAIVK